MNSRIEVAIRERPLRLADGPAADIQILPNGIVMKTFERPPPLPAMAAAVPTVDCDPRALITQFLAFSSDAINVGPVVFSASESCF